MSGSKGAAYLEHRTRKLDLAKRWVNEDVRRILEAEIANEANGGVTPATLSSTIDSLSQGLLDAMPSTYDGEAIQQTLIALLVIRNLLSATTNVRELL